MCSAADKSQLDCRHTWKLRFMPLHRSLSQPGTSVLNERVPCVPHHSLSTSEKA